MSFPTALDNLTDPQATDRKNNPSHAGIHQAENAAIEALEAKVGIDSSAVVTSLDYLVKNASSSDPGHKHTLANGATDVTATAAELNYSSGVTSAIQSQINAHLSDTTTHGTTGDIVGTSDTQTLTNKTITSPIIRSWNGWEDANETWTWASGAAANNTFYGTFTISGDQTSKYSAGMKVKFTQPTNGTKYGFMTKVAHAAGTTTVTVFLGTDYDLDNEAITSPYYSVVDAPQGFPKAEEKWVVLVTDNTDATQANPGSGTWYNIGTLSISVPIGSWRLGYDVNLSARDTSSAAEVAANVTLSTANNSESNTEFTCQLDMADTTATGTSLFVANQRRELPITTTALTSYYLNAKTTIASMGTNGNIYYRGSTGGLTRVYAICAYL